MDRRGKVCATLLTCATLLAHAEEKPADEADVLDEIEVTGTHIRGVDLEMQRSIQILRREDLDRTGMTNVGDILQALIPANGQTLNRNSANADPLRGGTLHLNLRGLGDNRTLVLVNGQ